MECGIAQLWRPDDPLGDAAKEVSRAVEKVAESLAKTGKRGLNMTLNPTPPGVTPSSQPSGVDHAAARRTSTELSARVNIGVRLVRARAAHSEGGCNQ